MLVKTSNNIQGVAAANDGLANAVVVALKARKLQPIALSGQDATEQGVQNIISGWQTMTVWKDTRLFVPESSQAFTFRHVLTGAQLKPADDGSILLADVFRTCPVALLLQS